MELEAYNDADWVGSIIDGALTIVYCTFFGWNLVTWRSKKQSVVTNLVNPSFVYIYCKSEYNGKYKRIWCEPQSTRFET